MEKPTTGFLGRMSNNMDAIAAFGVIGIVAMIVLPLPPFMLDLLLTFNLTFALVIILLTMFTTEILQFSIFPTLLLITTLFRLGLNISSTRLILSRGQAGQVIEAFGSFVTGNNYIVGAIIFIIIVVVQFVVITNGAGRVAEVAARFTLDGMPGKQMSIDADLNAGIITDEEARIKRQKLQNEADFYGAMDGASKFVKGDAIAGIVIVIINFIGGIAIFSWQEGLSLVEALQRFGILTIGDGLVSQIPALLISIASGILVTRSATNENFGTDLSQQLFSFPKVIFIASVVIFVMGLIPALPAPPFIGLSIVAGTIAYILNEYNKQEEIEKENQELEIEESATKEPEEVTNYIQVEPFEVEIAYGLIPLVDESSGGDLLERIAAVRRQAASDIGIIVQPIRIRDNLQLDTNEYVIKIKGNEVARGEILHDHLMVMDPGNGNIDIKGIDTKEPAFNLPAKWVEEDLKEKAEMKGYTIVDPTTVLITHLKEVINNHSHELLGRQEIKTLLDTLKERYNAVIEELIPDLLSIGELQKVLRNLLRENVAIKDLVTILETLADHAVNTKDTEILTEYVRHALSRTIVKDYVNEENVLQVLTIHPELEEMIHNNIQKSFQGSFPAIDPNVNTKILETIHELIEAASIKQMNPVILAAPRIRSPFKRMIEMAFPNLAVLSLNEIPNNVEIEAVGMVRLNENSQVPS
ncbi:MAG: flagellar biosynthesis protein FlhA [Firmicutes bacterium]|nr:flagellar biosynthesis protein FlhA [Bacillota bacterium]